jgi:hypothetical protein
MIRYSIFGIEHIFYIFQDWVVKTLTELKYIDTTKSVWLGVKRNANDGWLGNQPFYQWLDGQTYNDSLM